MANPNLITVAQLKSALCDALDLLETMDESKPVNIAIYGDHGDILEHTAGFVTAFSITADASMDEDENAVNVDFNWTEA